ncbi:glycosyltransferase family 2 protein [Roseibium sp.]|uniref:glycosyltransferase family 2 protein n=1 Tax=Roseibium sp. TaxID=1936156 RepID=UPI003A96CF85
MRQLCKKLSFAGFRRRVSSAIERAAPVGSKAGGPVLTIVTPNPEAIVDAASAPQVLQGNGLTLEVLHQASGYFVAYVRQGDRLPAQATSAILQALTEATPDAALIYGDAIQIDHQGRPQKPLLKPAFDPLLFRSIDYLSDLAIFRRDRLIPCLAGSPPGSGASITALLDLYLQHYDETNVYHLPVPLIETPHAPHLRAFPTSAEKTAPDAPGLPPVTVLIPSRNGFDLISRTLQGVLEETDYPDLRVHVVDNGSTDQRVHDLYEYHVTRHSGFSYEINQEAFNFSRSVNRGLARFDTGAVLLLNNDIEVITDQWLKQMVACLDIEKTGIVGAKLLYPDDRLQHAGVTIGTGGLASHCYYKRPRDTAGRFGRLRVPHSSICVTGAVMLISEDCRKAVGPWDEENFAIAYNDVDYCLRAYKAGFRTVWTPHAELYHHESVTRGMDRSRARAQQFQREKAALKRLHETEAFEDPTSSPWLSKQAGHFLFRRRSALPGLRNWWDQT